MYVQHFIRCPFCYKNLRDDLTKEGKYRCGCHFNYEITYCNGFDKLQLDKIYTEIYCTNKYLIYMYAGFKDTAFFRRKEVISFFYTSNKIAPYFFTDEEVENYMILS